MPRTTAQPTQAQLDNLADTFLALSDADKSTLITAAGMPEPNAAMMTAIESANFPLWTRLPIFLGYAEDRAQGVG